MRSIGRRTLCQPAESPIRGHSNVAEGMRLLRRHFSELDAPGPSNYAKFFLGIVEVDNARDGLRRFARAVVMAFLNRWDELQSDRGHSEEGGDELQEENEEGQGQEVDDAS